MFAGGDDPYKDTGNTKTMTAAQWRAMRNATKGQ